MSTIAAGEIVPLLVRPLTVSTIDHELGVRRRWTVRNPAIPLGEQGSLHAVMEDYGGALVCSCVRLGCRDIEAVRASDVPIVPVNPCVQGDPDRRVE